MSTAANVISGVRPMATRVPFVSKPSTVMVARTGDEGVVRLSTRRPAESRLRVSSVKGSLRVIRAVSTARSKTGSPVTEIEIVPVVPKHEKSRKKNGDRILQERNDLQRSFGNGVA